MVLLMAFVVVFLNLTRGTVLENPVRLAAFVWLLALILWWAGLALVFAGRLAGKKAAPPE